MSRSQHKEKNIFIRKLLEIPQKTTRQSLLEQLYCKEYEEITEEWLITVSQLFRQRNGTDKEYDLKEYDLTLRREMNMDQVYLHAIYKSRSLSYQYIRQGFNQGCDETIQCYLNNIRPVDLCNYLSDHIRAKFTYGSTDILSCIVFEDHFDQSARKVIQEYIQSKDNAEVTKLVQKWTGSEMVKNNLRHF